MPCLASSFFDAMSGVKKQPNFLPAIICPTSALKRSFAKFGQVIVAIKFKRFLTPDMA